MVVELSPEPISIHGEGRLLYVNPAAVKLMGAAAPPNSQEGRCWTSSTPTTGRWSGNACARYENNPGR
ncbi:MAG: PAS domain-containing protein [Pyrinomonadaceae bacterium]